MTLNTSIHVEAPADVKEVFAYCRHLLGCTEKNTMFHRLSTSNRATIGNNPGQGLPAWLIVYYGVDGPLECDECPERECYDSDEDYEEEKAEHTCFPPYSINVTFDTTYGYQENGAGCSDLHAWLVRELGRWLDAHGLPWSWQNEFTGEWFERYDGLDEFGDANLGTLIADAEIV